MDINVKTLDQATVVGLAGEIDGKTAPQAQDQIVPLTRTCSKLILDLTGVSYMSSAGLRMLLLVYRQMTANGGRISLVGLSDDIKDTMSSTGFLQYFTTFDTVDAAIQAQAQGQGAA